MPQSRYQYPTSEPQQEIESHELKTIFSKHEVATDVISTEKESEVAEAVNKNAIQVRNNIPLSQFPDFVVEMSEENQQNRSNLSTEYSVSNQYSYCILLGINYFCF